LNDNILVIGSGVAGMAAACCLAKAGCKVTVVEKQSRPGGRAGQLKAAGFTFDTGPSWYWMPDVFERFFGLFGKKTQDYYTLERLSPSYRVYWEDNFEDIPADYAALKALFEKLEPGSGQQLDAFLAEAAFKYRIGMQKLVYKPGLRVAEFIDADIIKNVFRLDVLNSMKSHVAKYFKHPHIRQLLEFPVLFLGAMPDKIPALYSLMNYADIMGGTWYPQGGMYKIAEAMHALATELGVQFLFEHDVTQIHLESGNVTGITAKNSTNQQIHLSTNLLVSGADYHFTESLLPKHYRNYSDAYWERRVMAPGCLLYYVGLNKKLGVPHHSLFFDAPFETHAKEIYQTKTWPSDPLFYVSVTSATDSTVAPPGCENLFILIPVAAGLQGDDEALRDKYFGRVMQRLESHWGEALLPHVIYKKSYGLTDFSSDFNSFKGNAYGLANTLSQTALLKPACRSKKVKNLFFTGQLTVPGPGLPPSLISGEVVAGEVMKYINKS
jgi:phytoene desaturase